jgi:hypothetical protein
MKTFLISTTSVEDVLFFYFYPSPLKSNFVSLVRKLMLAIFLVLSDCVVKSL